MTPSLSGQLLAAELPFDIVLASMTYRASKIGCDDTTNRFPFLQARAPHATRRTRTERNRTVWKTVRATWSSVPVCRAPFKYEGTTSIV